MSTLAGNLRTNLDRLTGADLTAADGRLADPNDPVQNKEVAWLCLPPDPIGGDWGWLASAAEPSSPDPGENGGGR